MVKLPICVALLVVAVATADQQLHLTRDRDFILRQEFVYQLFYEPEDLSKNYADIVARATTFRVTDLRTLPVNQSAVKRYIQRYNGPGLLPRGRSATVFNPVHYAEIRELFDILYSAENFESFALASVWSSSESNAILWFFAEAAALLRRRDTRLLRIPNLHEGLPQYSYNKDVIDQLDGECVDGIANNVINAEYSQHISQAPGTSDPEARVTYFTEDVGLSNYYFFLVLDAPYFLDSSHYRLPRRRGERYLDDHRQLLARYHLERLSNGLDQVEQLNFDDIFTGFYPEMEDYNGVDIPTRPTDARVQVEKRRYARLANDYQRRLLADIGEFPSFDAYATAVQGNADSADLAYYGAYEIVARHILGYAPEPSDDFHVIIGALENYNAGLRDPAFYRMFRKIVGFGLRYKSRLAPYTRNDLNFQGVSVEDVSVGKIVTYFEEFDSLLNGQRCRTLARQPRLNHGNFSVTLRVNARQSAKAMVRLFLGPKCDSTGREIDFDSARPLFFQLDQFSINLTRGANQITREDGDFTFQVAETPRSDAFYRLIERAVDEESAFGYYERPYGYPRHLIIPKGRRDGLRLRLLVIVSPVERIGEDDRTLVSGRELDDGRSLGFPVDRRVDDEAIEVDNLVIREVVVYHEG